MGEDTNIKPGDPQELRRQLADTETSARLRVRSNQCSRYRPDTNRMATGDQPPGRFTLKVDETFGRLRVIGVDRRLHGKRAAVVRCACGSPDKRIRIEHLLSGDIKSCGCLRAELMDTWRRLREDDDAAAAQTRDEVLAADADRYGMFGPPRR